MRAFLHRNSFLSLGKVLRLFIVGSLNLRKLDPFERMYMTKSKISLDRVLTGIQYFKTCMCVL